MRYLILPLFILSLFAGCSDYQEGDPAAKADSTGQGVTVTVDPAAAPDASMDAAGGVAILTDVEKGNTLPVGIAHRVTFTGPMSKPFTLDAPGCTLGYKSGVMTEDTESVDMYANPYLKRPNQQSCVLTVTVERSGSDSQLIGFSVR